jgi:ATP-binding cassette subfamily B protein
VVKSFGAEAREDARLAGVVGRWRTRVRRTWLRYNYTSTAQLTVLLCFRASVIGGAILLWIAGRASPGDVTYVLTSYYIIHAYLRDVGMHINNLQRSVNDMEELVAIHGEPIGIADAPGAKPIDIRGGRIVFDGVTFHYGGHRAPLYDGLSVDIRAGERVGLVGRSGSGKTTFDVSGGKILIDGQDIADATQDSLRSQIAIVQQDPILFHRSLAENIAYGRPGASVAAIEQAARLANAHEFILRLPKGYGTLVGERGVKLSGGERQRVALARAFLADAPVLILDEATSSLDSESEGLIQQAMERLMKGRTSIVIAHRLSTVRSLDRILVFDRGDVVEQGTHAMLTARAGGIYRGLFERQATEFGRVTAAE